LHYFFGLDDWRLELLPRLAEKVAEYSKIPIHERTPIVGGHAFTHTSDLHVKAVRKNPQCYEAMDPGKVGMARRI